MSKSKQKGTAFETEVVNILREWGFDAERQVLTGALDRGDIRGVPFWTLECKNEKAITLASYMDEAERESVNNKTPYFAAIVKRRMRNATQSYVVMPLWIWAKYIQNHIPKLPDPEDAFFFEGESGDA